MKKTSGYYRVLLLMAAAFGLTVSGNADIITFSGQIDIIFEDDGTGVFAGSPLGSAVNGFIDDQTFNGEVTVGGTTVTFGCCIAAGGLDVTDNLILDADTVALLNSLPGSPGFAIGQTVDGVDIEGDVMVTDSHRLEAGVSYILRPDAFASGDLGEYPFAPNDVLLALFFIIEEDGDNDVYDIIGVFASD
ncbi:MAG: hypothetical protein HKN70_04510, partial [Gammaproteobacteria bacterium]|nr:hypothetical protein [Gammaproteobacteria bacterium]